MIDADCRRPTSRAAHCSRRRRAPFVRPRSACAKSIFDILEHRFPGQIEGTRVVDLFAGTGALAIEALSRGARFALLVDNGAEARALLRANVEALALGGVTRIWRVDATKLGSPPAGGPFAPSSTRLTDRVSFAQDLTRWSKEVGWSRTRFALSRRPPRPRSLRPPASPSSTSGFMGIRGSQSFSGTRTTRHRRNHRRHREE